MRKGQPQDAGKGGGFLVLLFNMDVELGGNETETGTLSLKN